MLLIRVEIEDADGQLLHSYVMNHDDPQQRRVLGEQVRNAFLANQTVITYPEIPQ